MKCLAGNDQQLKPNATGFRTENRTYAMNLNIHIKLPEGSIEKQTTTLNLGPTHPATHGVFQNIVELDGERIVDAVQTVGYIHRAFEKIAERRPLYQITPLTDRMNYCSSPINNMGWHHHLRKITWCQNTKTC